MNHCWAVINLHSYSVSQIYWAFLRQESEKQTHFKEQAVNTVGFAILSSHKKEVTECPNDYVHDSECPWLCSSTTLSVKIVNLPLGRNFLMPDSEWLHQCRKILNSLRKIRSSLGIHSKLLWNSILRAYSSLANRQCPLIFINPAWRSLDEGYLLL